MKHIHGNCNKIHSMKFMQKAALNEILVDFGKIVYKSQQK